tara:strand:+ start:1279 stop:2670 length:1392 start_codon:yes stop_codon:yes gene_type:complete
MGAFIPQPEEYWIWDNLLEEHKPTMSFIQFVPGVVVSVVTGKDSGKYEGDLRRINSIRALPHIGGKGIKKKSMLGEEHRYYPLLRGVQEAPSPGDPVLLTDIGGVQYFLGPLNTQGKPNFNVDKFKNDEVRSGGEVGIDPEGASETSAFVKRDFYRLQKLLNPDLDNPVNTDDEQSKIIHGDLIFEGRHGNSLRIGSRNVNPYVIISNGRMSNNPIETTLDGTILGIIKQGTIRTHFNMDKKEGKKYEFVLADDEKELAEEELRRSISKTFTKGIGRGLVDKPENDDPDINKTIYGYEENQLFASSGRITFNARKESMFLSAHEHIHLGSGNTMTFSTSNNILTEAATSVRTNTPLFKVNSEYVYIDGRSEIVLGDPLLGDIVNQAVIGNGLVLTLVTLVNIIKSMAAATSSAIENRAKAGFSVKQMMKVQKELDKVLGTNSDGVPEKLENQILSKRVYITTR